MSTSFDSKNESIPLEQNGTKGTKTRLSTRQLKLLEALINRTPDQTMEDVIKLTGVPRTTVYRYLKNGEFLSTYRERLLIESTAEKGRIFSALVKGCVSPGPSQAGLQKLYWQMAGELKDQLEISGPNGGPIESQTKSTIDLSALPLDTLLKIRDDLRKHGSIE
jgi:AcrR family transcriptional regulator